MAEERLIRKYANRRLYDAQDSRHVTLDDLRKLIAGGQRVKVLDDKSGADITRSILLQIIASQEQFGTPVLSLQLLRSEEHTSELQSPCNLVCRLLLEKKKNVRYLRTS